MTARRLARWDGVAVEELASRWRVPLVEAYRLLGSTNDRALEVARQEGEPWSVIVADEQSAGRGRRGSRWVSPAGHGLLMSILLPPTPDAAAPALPLLVGLAAAEAVEEAAPGARVGIKWPNDLWIDGRKVGGVLCEASRRRAVAGIGINVRTPFGGVFSGLDEPVTALDVNTSMCPIRSVLGNLIVKRLRVMLPSVGRPLAAPTLAALRGRDALVGRSVWTESAGEGVAAGIAPDGSLTLERPDGTTARVVAGRVRLR